ncbi:type IV toxin-antitoxin system AbiEi family antitoxin domain-containing protein [Arthrobacter sp. ISL-85]|uniref:type IV toxin-antitoxin system AbiEi family antitoxin domain-containing protein n=1 Tax=Arthrobacter sp. ISL-85 TaxID=2819115 RepID=UPI001BE9576D|nr:type IV toxin-antitoxin system AbiEi family antitoxin domain-containing protein [Arthrobacter sp. ISL-85]MBT2566872.1 type IV toxin-antitoxin system AbiEi family antitoxin domain-containing protein [Arthrobacter sp. ISL-85]
MTPQQPVRLPALPGTGNLWRTGQLHEKGLNSRALKALVLHGKLVRLRHGCYVRAELWEKQTAPVRSRQLIRAHAHGTLTTSTGGYVYSHTSAARLHDLYLWDVDDKIHLLLPGSPSSERLGKDVRGHTRPWTGPEVVTLGGLRVTSLERTVVDCAMMLGYRQALVLMDHALRLGADKALIESMAEGLQGRRGIRTLRLALAHADPRSESAGETLTRELLARLNLPLPEPQVAVATRAGQYRLDFAWKEKKVALEFDGKAKYFDYRPTPEVLLKERQRENALTENGWTFVRVKWADLFHEHEFKARVLAALRR